MRRPSFIALLDLVPSWAYALAVLGFAGLSLGLYLDLAAAKVKEAAALTSKAALKTAVATAVASSTQVARAKEGGMAVDQTETLDALRKDRDSNAARAADLDRRLRLVAAAARNRASGPDMPQGASAVSAGDGGAASGLSDVARTDLVRLASSANDTRDTLKACRRDLHSAWQATNTD